MGIIFAPTYATLSMGYHLLKTKLLDVLNNINPAMEFTTETCDTQFPLDK